jgi:phosphoserine aminotransferase
MQPSERPRVAHFSSGPCAKRPGWALSALGDACVARSHRSKPGKAKLFEVIERSRTLLGLPADYRLAIVPGSDTGAVEMALWSLLGARGVDVLSWEAFGKGWVADLAQQLKLADLRVFDAPYGALPELGAVDGRRDIVFTWNGTTSGVCLPDGDWIPEDRQGLTICDATSAVFAVELPWPLLDVVTWSWQKVLGGEGGHGMIALSPRAVARLEGYVPAWPVPKLFQLAKGGKLIEGIFKGETINTPSLLAVEDALDGLRWAASIGGLPALIRRVRANDAVIDDWVMRTAWVEYLAASPAFRSPTSVCLRLADRTLDAKAQALVAAGIAERLEREGVACDIGAYRDAPPGLRLWAGATVEAGDLAALTPWLDWAYGEARAQPGQAA